MNRFQFVEDHKDAYGVKRLCEVIQIARSSFYAWLAAAPGRAARAAADAALAARIRVLQDPAQGGDRAYGAPRITADLNDGVAAAGRVNHKRVARVMREHQLAGIRLRRRVRTTIPDQSGRRFPDLIERDFSIGEPNRRYVGDITYLPIADGSNLYLATCIDLGSRKLAGWQVADHMRVGLVEDASRAARDRGTLAGAIFHSDHGSVYASKAYAALCEQLNIVQSMGAVGTSADNSLAESFNATLKRELLEGQAAFPDQATAYRAVFRWANRYNTRRRHSAIGQITPNNYETAYAETTSATPRKRHNRTDTVSTIEGQGPFCPHGRYAASVCCAGGVGDVQCFALCGGEESLRPSELQHVAGVIGDRCLHGAVADDAGGFCDRHELLGAADTRQGWFAVCVLVDLAHRHRDQQRRRGAALSAGVLRLGCGGESLDECVGHLLLTGAHVDLGVTVGRRKARARRRVRVKELHHRGTIRCRQQCIDGDHAVVLRPRFA